VILHEPAIAAGLPRPAAISTCAWPYAGAFTLRGGASVLIRPIRPEDEPLLVAFHGALSEESVYHRYAGVLRLDRRVAHERLARLCLLDPDRELALVAVRRAPEGGEEELLGVGRLTRQPGTADGEFALLVRDDVQGRGLGTELLRRLVDVGRRVGLGRVVGDILSENGWMQRVARSLGFSVEGTPGDPMVRAVRSLAEEGP
jgi:acetyltransferase